MTTPAEVLLEVLERPYFDGESFTTLELLAIVRAEKLFAKPPSAASVGLRLNHLVKVGKLLRVNSEQVIVPDAI